MYHRFFPVLKKSAKPPKVGGEKTLRWTFAVTLSLHLALITALLVTAQNGLGLIAGLMLLAPLPGLLRGRAYTAAWATMLLAFYCALLLAEGYAAPEQRAQAFGLATLAAADFVALIFFVKVSARASGARTAG